MRLKVTIGVNNIVLFIPLVAYLLDDDVKLKHESFCFISDDNTHDHNFVYKI